MAYSTTDICNLALAELGDGHGITGFPPTDTSQAATLCALHFPRAANDLLREFAWGWATKYAALALVAEADDQDWADEWAFSYRYPADCARIIGFVTGDRTRPEPVPYGLGKDADGRLIYTDESDARIAYTVDETDTTQYPADFCQVLVARMIARLAMPITGKADYRRAALEEAEVLLAKAKVSDLMERGRDPQGDAEHVRVRV